MSDTTLELCQELKELSGWDDTETWLHIKGNGDTKLFDPIAAHIMDCDCPHYTTDYLLGKLPKTVDFPEEALKKIAGGMSAPAYLILCQHIDTMTQYWEVAYRHEDSDYWIEQLKVTADTLKEALLKLAINLFKAKILKKEDV